MIVHPEVGKWLIALGEKAFGMDPFGWRVAAAVVGSLMVLVMCRLARRMTGSTLLGLVAGLLLSLDGLQFVLSRLALLDIFLAFFMLCGVHCLVADRDWYRARLARLVPEQVTDPRSWGPVRGLLFRPWLLAGGVCFGLGDRHQVDGALPARRVRPAGAGCGAPAPAARSACGGRCCARRSSTACRRSCTWCWSRCVVYIATWTGWLVHAARVRGAPLLDAVHPLSGYRTATRGLERDALADRPSRTPRASAR